MKIELPDLKLLRLDFRIRANASVSLPPFLGSTLRGALGRSLKRVFCFVPHEKLSQLSQKEKCQHRENCEHDDIRACWFAEACPFQFIFETKNFDRIPKSELPKFLRGNADFPRLVITIPPDLKVDPDSNRPTNSFGESEFNKDFKWNDFSAGETLDFSLLLLGKAVHFWAQVLVAVRLFETEGLGEDYKRTPFSLIEAFAHDAAGKRVQVFSDVDKRVSNYQVAPVTLEQMVKTELMILNINSRQEKQDSLKIRFLSPTSQRILFSGELGFHRFVTKIARRIEELAFLYAEPSQKINYHEILTGAGGVRTEHKSLQYYFYKQHSKSQDQDVPRYIFTGEIIYHGENLMDFLPFLAAGEILNVGAGTSSGCGRFIATGI